MKRIISLLLVFALLLPCMGLQAEAAATSGSCGKNLTWKFDTKTGTLTISGTGPMNEYDGYAPWRDISEGIRKVVIRKGVTSICNGAFNNVINDYDNLKTVIIPDSVTSIGKCAFYRCKGLTSVNIPDSVTTIGDYAFYWCNGLTSVNIPDSVTSIGSGAFSCCNGLTSVTIPDSVTTIGDNAFSQCDGLTSVNIPDSVTSIGHGAFFWCKGLTSVTISGSVTSIADYTFAECLRLTSVTIPDSVTSVGKCAFADCSGLTSVTIPDSVTSIGKWAFNNNCSSLKDVYYGGSPSQRDSIDIDSGNTKLTNATWHYGKEDPLLPPTVQIATKAATGKPRLSWDAVEGADFYRIYRATYNSEFTYLKSTRSTSFTDSSAVTGENYYYKVKAVEESGTVSRFSNTVNRCCDLPRPEVSATVNAATGKPKLTWEAVDGAQCYRIYRRTSGSAYTYLDSTTSTAFTDKTAEAGINYHYQVKAVNSNSYANSAHSLSVNRACDLPRPVVTVGLKNGSPQITWEKIDGAEKYRVYRATSKSGEYELVKSTVTANSFTDTDATAGKTYYYKVRAIHSNPAANSAWSSAKSVTAK